MNDPDPRPDTEATRAVRTTRGGAALPAALPAVLPGALLVLALTVAAGAVWVGARLADLESEVRALRADSEHVRAVLALTRLEVPSEGRGIAAVLDQVGYWAPMLESAATPGPHVPYVEERLGDCLDAIGALGPDAYEAIYARLEQTDNDEERKWLLRAALQADKDRGKELLVRVLRSTRLSPTPRLRFLAADELLAIDKPLAGEVLRDVLTIESARGIQRQVPPALRLEYESYFGTNQFADFFNFIPRFVRSEHPDVVGVLTMLIGRDEHDRMTYQECIRSLGRLKATSAVNRIKELYQRPPGRTANPLFLNICLQALADIQGADACRFLRQQLDQATDPTVVTKLQALLKELCP